MLRIGGFAGAVPGVRGVRAALCGAAAAALLAGCPAGDPAETSTQVDRDRIQVLTGEPVLDGAEQPLRITVGRVLDGDRGWDRGQVLGTLIHERSGAATGAQTVDQAQRRLTGVLDTLRSTGWTVLWTRCTPSGRQPAATGKAGATPPAGSGGAPAADQGYWQWLATGYKINAGVSYGFRLESRLDAPAALSASLLLLAPNHRDQDNLFPDAPAGPAPGSTCIERPTGGVSPVESGTAITMSGSRDWPGHSQPPGAR